MDPPRDTLRRMETPVNGIDAKTLAKIKKCLALAASDNPNEAATAMRQARALMDKHAVSSHDVIMADIGESAVKSKTMARDKPAQWETQLIAIVAKAFGCHAMIDRQLSVTGKGIVNEGKYIFVGVKQQAEIAAYTASVLARRCKTARQACIAETFEGQGRGGKGRKAMMTRMGDMFAVGWVSAIQRTVTDFANPPELDAAIRRHIDDITEGRAAQSREIPRSKIGQGEYAAALMGQQAAAEERLYRPMGQDDAPLGLPSDATG